jgi:hypothetical protein
VGRVQSANGESRRLAKRPCEGPSIDIELGPHRQFSRIAWRRQPRATKSLASRRGSASPAPAAPAPTRLAAAPCACASIHHCRASLWIGCRILNGFVWSFSPKVRHDPADRVRPETTGRLASSTGSRIGPANKQTSCLVKLSPGLRTKTTTRQPDGSVCAGSSNLAAAPALVDVASPAMTTPAASVAFFLFLFCQPPACHCCYGSGRPERQASASQMSG